ncbi:hypothetical protein ACIRO1_46400 [Streptomyces sp. NPDC102381]|uniref:hypothetical protein n=1 Tax=Streptomyces sp. NPDC102381 TaxID=3366164 RepID=UPI00381D26E7
MPVIGKAMKFSASRLTAPEPVSEVRGCQSGTKFRLSTMRRPGGKAICWIGSRCKVE